MKRIKTGGFTVVEILVALVILSFGIFGVLDFYTQTVNISHYNALQLQAQSLAHKKAVELSSMGMGMIKPTFKLPDGPLANFKYPEKPTPFIENDQLSYSLTFNQHKKFENINVVAIEVFDSKQLTRRLFSCEVYVK